MIDEPISHGRRSFLAKAAMTMAATPFGIFSDEPARTRRRGAEPSATTRALEGSPSRGVPRELGALSRATTWLNSRPLPASTLVGRVVLVQFGTYTCINWLRTLPYVRAWAEKYKPGMSVVGVHTPEFTFEKNVESVRRALQQMKIDFPIAIDNDYAIWRAFNNRYWPAFYFIDARGRLRHRHFGEGEYERSEAAIQRLLAEAGGSGSGGGAVSVHGTGIEAAPDWRTLKSRENYVGHARTENFTSPGGARSERRHVYLAPKRMTLNEWALVGEWTMGREAAVLHAPRGRIVYRFHGRDLHLVMGPPLPETSIRFRVMLDGQPPGPAHGVDVDDSGSGMAVEQRLYQLIRQPGPIVDRTLEIEFVDAGVEAFAFTFG